MQWDTKMKMSKNFDCHCNYGLVGTFGQLTTCSEAGNPTSIPQQGFFNVRGPWHVSQYDALL